MHIDETLDWNQPIENFEFIKGLPNLKVFSLGFKVNKTEFPAFLPLLHLKKLKKLKIVRDTFKTNKFAFLQIALPKVEGCDWDLFWDMGDKFTFLVKRAGLVYKTNPVLTEKCRSPQVFLRNAKGCLRSQRSVTLNLKII